MRARPRVRAFSPPPPSQLCAAARPCPPVRPSSRSISTAVTRLHRIVESFQRDISFDIITLKVS